MKDFRLTRSRKWKGTFFVTDRFTMISQRFRGRGEINRARNRGLP